MRTFVLGVGAQKSGTTWLSKHLDQSKNYIKGLVKEYHLFDALYLEKYSFRQVGSITSRLKVHTNVKDESVFLKNVETMMGFYQDEKNYFDYFDYILKKDTDFTADVTPSYSGLTSNLLANIKKEFNQRGIAVKIVFLMREPISRLESAIKMGIRRKGGRLREISGMEMARKMHEQLNSHYDLLRSNYSYTCQQIDQAFPDNEIFYGFYETLFSEREIKRLSSFLNMLPKEFDAETIFNSTPKLFKYPLADVNKFRENVQDRYQFVSERFGFDLLIWDKIASNMVEQKEI
jgi:hypothetical protein